MSGLVVTAVLLSRNPQIKCYFCERVRGQITFGWTVGEKSPLHSLWRGSPVRLSE